MSRITWLPSVPWEPTATVLILTFCLTKALIVLLLGGAGSPSLMMIMCFTAASVSFAKLAAAIFKPPSNAGMSPIVMRSMRASIIWRPGPTRIMPPCDWPQSHWSVLFHWTRPQ